MIWLVRFCVQSTDCAILKQRRGRGRRFLRLGGHYAELRQFELLIIANFVTVEVELQVANQTVCELFHHDTDLRFLRIAADVLKSNYFILMVHCQKLELLLGQIDVLEIFN